MKEYFSHDYHATGDEKIIRLLQKMGYEGYGIFWRIVEKIYENEGTIKADYELLSFDLRIPYERIKNVCEDFELFEIIDGNIISESITRRLEERAEKSAKAKKSIMSRWGTDTNVLRNSYERKGIKEKKRKEKERKDTTTTAGAGGVEMAKTVNWDKCHNDIQRLLAYYVSIETPVLYKTATQAQANGVFKRYGRAASEILAVAGDLPTSKRAFDLAMAHFNKKGLSWNLSTVAANCAEFVNQAIGEKQCP
jgi:hypothetical protein